MDDNTAHIGTGESESKWRRFTQRSVLIPVIAVLLVAIGVWVFFAMKSGNDTKQTKLQSAIKASDAAFETGDYQKSLEELKGAVDQARTKDEKVDLYSNLAAAAASSGDMGQAVRYLEEKHKIAPDTASQDAYLLGSYYERIEDNAKALEYYRQALEYLEKNRSQDNDVKAEGIKARIEALEDQQ